MIAIAVITVGWLALFGPQLLGRVFVLGDAPAYRAFAEFSRARWQEYRDRTFWNPYVFAGLPAVASLADPRPQYLPDGLLDAVEAAARRLPPLAFPLACALAGMIAMALLARALWGSSAAGISGRSER